MVNRSLLRPPRSGKTNNSLQAVTGANPPAFPNAYISRAFNLKVRESFFDVYCDYTVERRCGMDEQHLYEQIADSIRHEILEGRYKSGDRLPSVRDLCELWHCTPGTIQRAYQELGREGLILSQAGRGTQVAGAIPPSKNSSQNTLRKASLVHRSEAFLLEAMTAGYNLEEIQSALDLATDRWRALERRPQPNIRQRLRFAGSHDMALSAVTRHYFGEVLADVHLQITFTGSLGGLLAIKEGKAELAGAHLWDAETDSYNLPFVQKTIPNTPVCLVTFTHRRLGLMVAPGNPLGIRSLADLSRPEIRFVNRQAGSGTRVWLDSTLERMQIDTNWINGYRDERMTHTDVARSIAEGAADLGLGLESAALAYGLEYLHLTLERYDLVMLEETAHLPALEGFIQWLGSAEGRGMIGRFQGYEVGETGNIIRINK
jgi:molybdate-binding protein/DNA-binding transcriptional regulator YhcF (GntR family)